MAGEHSASRHGKEHPFLTIIYLVVPDSFQHFDLLLQLLVLVALQLEVPGQTAQLIKVSLWSIWRHEAVLSHIVQACRHKQAIRPRAAEARQGDSTLASAVMALESYKAPAEGNPLFLPGPRPQCRQGSTLQTIWVHCKPLAKAAFCGSAGSAIEMECKLVKCHLTLRTAKPVMSTVSATQAASHQAAKLG